MNGTRGYALTVAAGLLGAAAVALGVARPWVSATARQAGNPLLEASVSGAEVAPLAGALGVVLLAAFGAVLATRGVVRRVVGVVVVVASATVVVAAVRASAATDRLESGLSAVGWAGGDYSTATEPWRWVSLIGALVCLAAGASVAWFGGGWVSMGSRYEAPVATAAVPTPEPSSAQGATGTVGEDLSETEAWRALDEGRDPTRHP